MRLLRPRRGDDDLLRCLRRDRERRPRERDRRRDRERRPRDRDRDERRRLFGVLEDEENHRSLHIYQGVCLEKEYTVKLEILTDWPIQKFLLI